MSIIIQCLFLTVRSITCQSVGNVRFTRTMVFWVFTPCSVMCLSLRTGWQFRWTLASTSTKVDDLEDGGRMFLRNIADTLPYRAWTVRRPSSEYHPPWKSENVKPFNFLLCLCSVMKSHNKVVQTDVPFLPSGYACYVISCLKIWRISNSPIRKFEYTPVIKIGCEYSNFIQKLCSNGLSSASL